MAISEDDGQSWTKVLDLETDQDEFSYPAIIRANGHIYVTYTSRRKQIIFCELAVE